MSEAGRVRALSDDELRAALASLPGWNGGPSALRRTYRFTGFRDALAFMQASGGEIDRLDHHPDWRNVYDRVEVTLTTHDAGNRVTEKDVALARVLEQAAKKFATRA